MSQNSLLRLSCANWIFSKNYYSKIRFFARNIFESSQKLLLENQIFHKNYAFGIRISHKIIRLESESLTEYFVRNLDLSQKLLFETKSSQDRLKIGFPKKTIVWKCDFRKIIIWKVHSPQKLSFEILILTKII